MTVCADPSASEIPAKTILLIDDEESVRLVAARMLKFLGFTALLAGGGKEGVELFRRHQGEISAVIVDMTMPDLDGEEVFRRVREIDNKMPVLVTSGYNEEETIEKFNGKGLTAFLQKPFTPGQFREKLKAAFGEKE